MAAEQQPMVVITTERTAVDIVTAAALQNHRRFVLSQKLITIRTVQRQGQQVLLRSVEDNAGTVRIWIEIMTASVVSKYKLVG